ncbi:MFS transporter [Actinomyces bowdenii]|uniref:MFS transporter n=1 Tax=Actinomyces bowdenii TaxID=131109 RepID=UPI00312C80C9
MPDPSRPAPGAPPRPVLADPRLRALLVICLFTYAAQNMLNVSIAPLARALALPEWVVGLAVSIAALTVTVLSQFWGRRSVAWGLRRVLLIALVLAAVSGCLFASAVALRSRGLLGAAATAAIIVVARGPFFGGAVAAIPPTGQALIARITPDEPSRVRGMSAFAGAVQLSIVVGSVLSSALGAWSIHAPVHATPLLILVALVIAAVAVPGAPGTPRAPWRTAGAAPPGPPRGGLGAGGGPRHCDGGALPPRVPWSDPRLLPWIGSSFGMFFASGVVQIIAGFIIQDRLHLPAERAVSLTAVMLLANAAGAMLTQLLIVPRLGWGPARLVRMGVSAAAVALAVLAAAPWLWLMAGATFAVGLCAGLVGPGFTAGGSLAVGPAEQGGVAGVLQATGALTWVFAPVTATALYGWHPLAPFALALGVLGASVLVAWAHPALRPRGRDGAGTAPPS